MNKDIWKGNWKQFKGEAQKKWGELTDDQLDKIEGSREKLIGQIQENQGIARDKAEEQVKEWEDSLAA